MWFGPNVQIEKRKKRKRKKKSAFKKVGHILYKMYFKALSSQNQKTGVLEVCKLLMVTKETIF